ncbi:hypothetical protein HUU05_29815 [candidate division KSB1 bacterium]|nr:hypothetical protein [candidate division KSB1 bacterium]
MYKNRFQNRVAGLDFWPYWLLQITRKHRRHYSLKVHAQLEHGDIIVGWQKGGMNPELWNSEEIVLLLGDAEPTHEEWRALNEGNTFAEPRPIWFSELQASGLMVIAQEHPQHGRLFGRLRQMNRATYEAMGWMGRTPVNTSYAAIVRN